MRCYVSNSFEENAKFKKGDIVVYKTNGICEIIDIRRENFDETGTRDFYILRSVYDPRMQVFVPTKSELSEKITCVLNIDDIKESIYKAYSNPLEWNSNDKERNAFFSKALMSCDRQLILSVYLLIKKKKAELEAMNKQINTNDSRILSKSEKMITEEFSYVLGISRDKIIQYIEDISKSF